MANDTAISALMKLLKEQMMYSRWPTPEEGILINSRQKEQESCSCKREWKSEGSSASGLLTVSALTSCPVLWPRFRRKNSSTCF